LDCEARYKTIETYAIKKRGAPPGTPVHPNQRKKGITNTHAVLTEDNVRLIRDLAEDNVTYDTIAKQFGIHKATVYRIVKRKLWSHVK
jgi:DNA invertase Pin-like site-specific DNA recombinase